jgi:hypothetical protein
LGAGTHDDEELKADFDLVVSFYAPSICLQKDIFGRLQMMAYGVRKKKAEHQQLEQRVPVPTRNRLLVIGPVQWSQSQAYAA